jgi:hypothetical protein
MAHDLSQQEDPGQNGQASAGRVAVKLLHAVYAMLKHREP